MGLRCSTLPGWQLLVLPGELIKMPAGSSVSHFPKCGQGPELLSQHNLFPLQPRISQARLCRENQRQSGLLRRLTLGRVWQRWNSWGGRERQQQARARNGLKPPPKGTKDVSTIPSCFCRADAFADHTPRSRTNYSQRGFSLAARKDLTGFPQPVHQFSVSNVTHALAP